MIADRSAIVATGLGVRRGGRWLLRPSDLGVTGGVAGLAGQPGTGKTTLLATFATLRRPTTGALEILGHDTGNSAGLRAIRARIGYLPARFAWAPQMTAGEFVAYAAYYKGMRSGAARAALHRADLTDAAGTQLAHLPPEVRLRAGLAATCVHEPDIVLLDEPLSRLAAGRPGDDTAAADLVPLIRSLAPVVLVTGTAPAALDVWCDRVFTLTRGRLSDAPGAATPPFGSPLPPRRSLRRSLAGPFARAARFAGTGV
ncbi:ATP-binding cassette domain-containing protein [Actinomadura flavalba]|uniref:ATP-binding cassette domain-containing protein n=1 Tax=Actinomadura flavalba TaxID=1120938 RepID=UPI000367CED3|nr:ATP-binding cassette domain-containing protein [Actinomadura flavalba]